MTSLTLKKTFAVASMGLALVLGGCAVNANVEKNQTVEIAKQAETAANIAALEAVLAAQPEDVKARYDARNPAETLAFFGIEPGMTVAEALPGGGWYSKILLPYLGEEGTLVGAHYPDDLWANFGFPEERTKAFIERSNNWVASTEEWGIEGGAEVTDYKISAMSDDMAGKADAVLFIRALHNLNRFNDKGGYMDKAVAETFTMLKPGGIVGVVQHEAPESSPDDWTDGSRGYLKKSAVIAAFEAGGFELVGDSDINANAADVPGEGDIVWRLPPSLNGTEEGTPERAAMEAIGESNRMTLKFKKPS
jgi:predicted methyltransferase